MKVKYTSSFRKGLKLAAKRGMNIDALSTVVNKLKAGEALPEKYRDHKLNGKYKGMRECHIAPDWLLIYKIDNDNVILTLVATGTHSDLLNM